MRKKAAWHKQKEFAKLIIASILVGAICTALGDSLKALTEDYENKLYTLAVSHPFLIFIFPLTGLSVIYLLRQHLFRKKENKGIKEIYDTLKTRHNELPLYKIPSHFINGFLTIIFGGSSGIEVATVVASASVGSVFEKEAKIHTLFRKELICAGVAAAVTVLFSSPIAGILFALEVILKKISITSFISISFSVLTVWLINTWLNIEPVFFIKASYWNYDVFPYFLLLGFISGLNSVYLTKSVLFFKSRFALITKNFTKILLGSSLISLSILFFPQLYGDGYTAMKYLFHNSGQLPSSYSFIFMVIGVLILKPLITSITLASGGDGGVFAPSLFIGAFLGLFLSFILSQYFNVHTIPINFMVIGMAAMLSASLHAPFTAVFLVCGLINNYTLFFPVLTACLVARLTAKMVIPYTVYSYLPVQSK